MTIKFADAWFEILAIGISGTTLFGGSDAYLAQAVDEDGTLTELLLHGDEWGYRSSPIENRTLKDNSNFHSAAPPFGPAPSTEP